jgi:hypothetical protein
MRNKLLFLIIVFFLLWSCVKVKSVVTIPEYSGVKFKKIMVVAIIDDMDFIKRVETQGVVEIRKRGGEAIQGFKLFSPFKKYSQDEFVGILDENNIDGILVFYLKGTRENTFYLPGSVFTIGQMTASGNSATYSAMSVGGGLYPLRDVDYSFSIGLMDRNNTLICYAESIIESRNNTCINIMMKKIISVIDKYLILSR